MSMPLFKNFSSIILSHLLRHPSHSPEVTLALLPELSKQDSVVRVYFSEGLGYFNLTNSHVQEQFYKLLNGKSQAGRVSAALALHKGGSQDPKVLRELIDHAFDSTHFGLGADNKRNTLEEPPAVIRALRSAILEIDPSSEDALSIYIEHILEQPFNRSARELLPHFNKPDFISDETWRMATKIDLPYGLFFTALFKIQRGLGPLPPPACPLLERVLRRLASTFK